MARYVDHQHLAGAHERELVALRRILHSQPELSRQEHVVTEMLVERLAVEGLEPRILSSGTGLICDFSLDPDVPPDPDSMPVVALRGDLDALAMDDQTGAPYRSQHPGIAHACGHDVHTAVCLGAALVLLDARRTAPRSGIVRLIFEPAEETIPAGADDVIAEGGLERVRAIFGVHCDPAVDVGRVGLRTGQLTCGADAFELHLTGPGGHTARPHLTVDLVRWVGLLADRLATLVQELADDEVTVAFGAVHAGHAGNVIPASAVLRGSFRTPERATWLAGESLIRAGVAELVAQGEGGRPSWEVVYTRGLPPVVNDVATTAMAAAVARRQLGGDGVVEAPTSRGGDSFGLYTERVPGTYVRLGSHAPGTPQRDLHSAQFDVDERAIAVGAALLAGCAVEALDAHA